MVGESLRQLVDIYTFIARKGLQKVISGDTELGAGVKGRIVKQGLRLSIVYLMRATSSSHWSGCSCGTLSTLDRYTAGSALVVHLLGFSLHVLRLVHSILGP